MTSDKLRVASGSHGQFALRLTVGSYIREKHTVRKGADRGYRRLTNEPLSGTIKDMSKATRSSKSFTVDRSILDYLQRTRSGRSRSERVNELLRRAILEEQYEALTREASEFFAAAGRTERAEARAFARASHRSLARAGD